MIRKFFNESGCNSDDLLIECTRRKSQILDCNEPNAIIF
jgi:hypothetical protein